MHKNLRKFTEAALMLALLMTLQALTKPLGQLVTGSCVNAVLAVTALASGLPGAIAVGLLSPILAYLLGIAPQILTVPVIMVGNTLYVTLLWVIARRDSRWQLRQLAGWLAAAVTKFAALYAGVAWLLCGVLSEKLLAAGLLKPPMLKTLPATFSWPQLITALIGGAVALAIVPVLRKALRRG